MRRLTKTKRLFLATVHLPFKHEDRLDAINLVVDTGSSLTIIDTSIVDYLGYSAREDAIDTSALDGAAGRSEGYVITLPTFTCLGFKLENFTVACHDMNTRLGVAGLLGMNFLEHFRVDMNYHTGEIHTTEMLK